MISFEFVAENFEQLEADFQREYGIDLRDALYGKERMGARRLTALIKGLSPQSETMRKVAYDGQEWGPEAEMLATLIEMVDHLNRMYHLVNFDQKKHPVWNPVTIPRPYRRAGRHESPKEEQISLFTNPGALGVVVFDPTNAPSLSKDVTE